jgi:hypothetical protein
MDEMEWLLVARNIVWLCLAHFQADRRNTSKIFCVVH